MTVRALPAFILVALTAAASVAARAEEGAPPSGGEANLGGGLVLSGAPTIQEIQAQQKACEARKTPRKATGSISEGTYRKMERIVDAIGKGQYAESEPKLVELADQSRGDYEKAIVLQTLGFVYASENKEPQAIKAFEGALATNSLPQQIHEQIMFNIAQMYLSDNKTDKGLQALNNYLQESCNPLPDAHILLASGYAEKKQWRDALKQVDLALVKAGTPKESWLQLKLALHYELKEFPRCAEVLVHLVGLSPMKEEYWKQLYGILYEIKKDPESLAVLSLADRRGFVKDETQYKNLSNMYMYMQIPLKAAQVLERGVNAKVVEANEKNLEALGNAWLAAREYDKAEAAMAKAAAASNKGELWKRLGQIQIEKESWKTALESLQKAVQKGGLKDVGETQMLIGVCAIELKQYKTADAALRAAMSSEKTAKMAAQWLSHLQDEIAYAAQTGAAPAEDDKAAPAETKHN